ncbi:MAG: RNA 3'-phosphate cyclase [Myxococcaceae bacterium]|nr:RNA 3'-phosphate cyclase [Myxococcaceae bacterium]
MIVLDGSEGEGGGQVLRSALSLSIITAQPFRLEKVRAKRRPPGLKAQHLTCVEGAARLSDAEVEGASIGSNTVTFRPRAAKAGAFGFHVGTAGSTNLLLHCLVYPLALAGGGALTLTGGSHVIASPSFDYVARVWAPLVRRWGFVVRLELELAGFFPEGGGRLWAQIEPVARGEDPALSTRPVVDRLVVRSVVGGLPLDIAHRQAETARRALTDLGLAVETDVESLPVAHSRGTAVLVLAESNGRAIAGFSALGERRVPAEEVGRSAARDARDWLRGVGALDEHAGDQVLLPMGLAAAGLLGAARPSRFRAQAITDHLTTHARVLEAFLPIRVTLQGDSVEVSPR